MIVELKRRAIKIPNEVALAAFGDDLLAALIEPSLTVYNQFPYLVGQEAASILIENIINKDTFQPFTKTIKGELIVRQSSLKNLNTD
jgi:LacI family transcriptional regulator